MNGLTIQKILDRTNSEFVERKGLGHPDTLADMLAEALSRNYSRYTLKKFGAVLHHNFDKTGLLGGKSSVFFGAGKLTSPIRVLINGRISTVFGSERIPYKKIINDTVVDFFAKMFPKMVIAEDLDISLNLSNASSPGRTEEKEAEKGSRKFWFEPRSLKDLPELKKLTANDTSLGCGYAPFSDLEKTVLKVEETLNSSPYKKTNPWCGSDIKVMANRIDGETAITLCVPQIAKYVPNVKSYKANETRILSLVNKIAGEYLKNSNILIYLNTRDKYDTNELYLTAIGSSIESGDEGLVGRGNRVNGLISSNRPMSMEGACGKNPVYHVGKLYNICAVNLAQKIYILTNAYTEVFLVSQSGQSLTRPWRVIVKIEGGNFSDKQLESVITKELDSIPVITKNLIAGNLKLW
jgi:S-adenosylmethionine synthetase